MRAVRCINYITCSAEVDVCLTCQPHHARHGGRGSRHRASGRREHGLVENRPRRARRCIPIWRRLRVPDTLQLPCIDDVALSACTDLGGACKAHQPRRGFGGKRWASGIRGASDDPGAPHPHAQEVGRLLGVVPKLPLCRVERLDEESPPPDPGGGSRRCCP